MQKQAAFCTFCALFAVSLAGCDGVSPEATVEALARDPERLAAVLRECRQRIVPAEDPACRAASEAWRRHFFGERDGRKPDPVPGPVAPSQAEPLTTTPTPWLAGS